MFRCSNPYVGWFDDFGDHKVWSVDRFKKHFTTNRQFVSFPDFMHDVFDDFLIERKTDGRIFGEDYKMFTDPKTGELVRPHFIPCGKCEECQINYAASWADRLMCESSMYPEEKCYFLTLTYDDDHVPVSFSEQHPDGFLTLSKEHVKSFLKKIRNYYSYHFGVDGIRFYLCGEYGSKTFRPHYHLILFGISIPDLKFMAKNFRGDIFYNSDLLCGFWEKGFVTISSVTWDSCCYTARYVTKKLGSSVHDPWYYHLKIQPEFSLSSRDPGIGFEFYQQNKEFLFEYQYLQLPSGRRVGIPRYFHKLMERDDPERYAALKEKMRTKTELRYDQFPLSHPGISEDDYYSGVHESFMKKIFRKLPRGH